MQELRQPTPSLAAAGRLLDGGAAAVAAAGSLARRGGPAAEEAGEVRCPRCDSANTKFCYYNNYNLAQPRHFCRACRRHWTKGGLLRNVPVGGGCRRPRPKRTTTPVVGADADASRNGAHGAHRDGHRILQHTTRAGAGASASSSTAVDGGAFPGCAVAQPSGGVVGTGTGAGPFAAGDTQTPPRLLPAPMFGDQAAAFASLFAAPRPLVPAFRAEEPTSGSLAEQPASPAVAAGSSDWPTAASDAGMFELTGSIAGDAPQPLPPAYWNWNPGCWTDGADPTIHLP